MEPSIQEVQAWLEGQITDDEFLAPSGGKYRVEDVERVISRYEESQTAMPTGSDRFLASFATTPEGKAKILEKQGGYDVDVFARGTPRERLMVDTEYGRRPVNPQGLDWSDLGAMGGDIPPTLLGTLGSFLPGHPFAGAILGEMAGEGITQGIGNLLGSEEGRSDEELLKAGAYGALGEGGARVGTRVVNKALAPFSGQMTQRVSRIPERAQAFDEAYGTEVGQRLPAAALTESRTLGAVEQRVAETPSTADDYIALQRRPYQGEVETLLSRIGRRRFGEPVGGKEEVGRALTGAAVTTKEVRKEAVDQAYDQLREMIAPNTPVIPEQSIQAVEAIWQRVSRDPSATNAAAREEVARLLDDVNNIQTFGQLDAFRENLGAKLGTPKGSEIFQVRGLEGQVRGLYRALRADVDAFYQGGGIATEGATAAFRERAAQEAEEAAVKAAAREETISLSQAIANLGGMDVSGMAAEEIPGKVGKRLRSLQTQAKNQGRPIKGPDLMANRLAEEYPELGIQDMRDLVNALRREDVFFEKVSTGSVENIEQAFLARPVTGQEVLGFDVQTLERNIEEATSLDQLEQAYSHISHSFEQGEISQFQRDRLRSLANNMAGALGEPRAKAKAGQLAEEYAEYEARAGRLGQEVAEKGKTARTMVKELADLDASQALRVFSNEEQAASIVDKMARFDAAEIRSIKQKIGADPIPSMAQIPQGKTSEGEQAWRLAQRAVFDHIAGKETIDRSERMTNDMVVRSGERMLTMLDRFKEGALEELIGEDATRELYSFAELISDADLAARFNRNLSRTSGSLWLWNLISGLKNGFGKGILYAAAQLGAANRMLKAVATPGGKRWVTEGALQDATSQNILKTLSGLTARGLIRGGEEAGAPEVAASWLLED